MDIIQCDICKNQSPDSRGMYIANGWCEVKLVSPWRKWNRFAGPKEYVFCNECMPFDEGSDPPHKTVLNSIKRFLGFNRSGNE